MECTNRGLVVGKVKLLALKAPHFMIPGRLPWAWVLMSAFGAASCVALFVRTRCVPSLCIMDIAAAVVAARSAFSAASERNMLLCTLPCPDTKIKYGQNSCRLLQCGLLLLQPPNVARFCVRSVSNKKTFNSSLKGISPLDRERDSFPLPVVLCPCQHVFLDMSWPLCPSLT